MRPLLILAFTLTLAAAAPAQASACSAAAKNAGPRVMLDHYIYDASLRREWEVLIDCRHPAAPAQMKLAPNTTDSASFPKRTAAAPENNSAPIVMKAGASVVVFNDPNAPTSIRLSGTAMETAFPGQPIRVRLNASGSFITGFVRGPHSVKLASAAKPQWGPQ
jgi:hypothetical protein